MDDLDLDRIISFLSFLVALIAALWEIHRFRRDKILSQLSDLKNLLIRIRSTFQYINYKISSYKSYDNFANECAFSVAEKFAFYFKDIESSEDLEKLLNNKIKMRFLYYALIKICDQSIETKQKILGELNDLKRVLFRYQTNMPVLITIIGDCLTLTRNMISSYTNLLLFDINEWPIRENHSTLIDSLKDLENYGLEEITETLILNYCEEFIHIMDNKIIDIFESNQKIIEIITDLVLEMNDDQLLKLQKWDQKKFSLLSQNQTQILNLTHRFLNYEALQSLVINWMFYKEQYKTHRRFKFKLGCIQIRRILNHICEEHEDTDTLAKFIDKYPEDLSVSVGTSEMDNIRERIR